MNNFTNKSCDENAAAGVEVQIRVMDHGSWIEGELDDWFAGVR